MCSHHYFDYSAGPEKVDSTNPAYDDFGDSPAHHRHVVQHREHSGYHTTADNVPQGLTGSTSRFVSEDTTCFHRRQLTSSPSPNASHITGDSNYSDTQLRNINEQGDRCDYGTVSNLVRSPSLNDEQKLQILRQYSDPVLNTLYIQHMAAHGDRRPLSAGTRSSQSEGVNEDVNKDSNVDLSENLNEDNYLPLIGHLEPSPDPRAPRPIYPAYAGLFKTAQEARTHRKRTRIAPKLHATDVERVKRYGRQYWVRRIYEAMIDITAISDGDASIHRQRFADAIAFDAADLEATAHHVFDSALAVHERGWNRPSVYHKKVVRGKLTDVSEKSLETRLARICLCLKQKKATVDDAMRGGVTLALLCDNPEARGFTKMSNNTGNKKRGERLRLAKGTEQQCGDDE